MISLFIDTSTERGVVGIFRDGILLNGTELPFGFSHSRRLFPVIVELALSCNLSPKDFDYVSVGTGPGSYTGIRVSAATAKALSAALEIPLLGISSLQGFVPENVESGTFLGIVDAKIGGFYTIVGKIENGVIEIIEKETVTSLQEIKERISSFSYIVTPTKDIITKRLDLNLPIIEQAPSLKRLGSLVHSMRGNDEKLNLLYLRKTQAEIEKEKL